MSAERRRHPRLPVDLPATLLAGGATHTARVKDICRDAALVECAHRADVGDVVSLGVTLGRGNTVQLDGRVIRDAGPVAGGHAFAVLFRGLDPAAATEIEVLLARLEREAQPPAVAGADGRPPDPE